MTDLRREVLMLGTSPDTRGGVASVVKIYQSAGLFSKWPITYLTTHTDGNAVRKMSVAFSSWLSFAVRLIWRRGILLHVHCASRASFWRKSAFIIPAVWVGRPVIFHLHGGGFMQFYEDECGLVAKRIVRYVLDHSTKIIVLSESWRTAISTITKSRKIRVIVNPALPFRVQPDATKPDPGTLLFLGRLGTAKGIYVLLDALAQMTPDKPDFRLICGGDGELDQVKRAAKRLGLDDRVTILGWVDEVRRNELLAAASIFVLPSFAEGLPMGILEAMSAGLPVVTSPVGGIPEAITDGKEGFLVQAGDAQALSEAIQKLLSDSKLREVMGSCARTKFDACFNADVVLPQLESIYRELGVQPKGKGAE